MSASKNLPNLIIAGVNKAGTTSLFSYLAQHPEVRGSSVKETCYFLPVRYGGEIAPLSDYERLFQGELPCSIIMEATPGYFYGGKRLIDEINQTLPNVKIVIVLRDPSKRLLSFFNFMKSMLLIDKKVTLEEYIKYCSSLSEAELKERSNNPYFGVEGGCYSHYLDDWVEQFGERLQVLFFDDLKGNPSLVLENLCEWLDVPPAFYEHYSFEVENQTSAYKNKRIHRVALTVNRSLEAVFRKYPVAKSLLRRAYGLLNLKGKSEFSLEEQEMAVNLYKEVNLDLMIILRKHGIEKFPNWLRGGINAK